jgi:hypothetical protein
MSDERIVWSCFLFASLSLSFPLFDESRRQDEENSMSRKGVVVDVFCSLRSVSLVQCVDSGVVSQK